MINNTALVEHIYGVDPLGNLMMRYPRDPDPSKMLVVVAVVGWASLKALLVPGLR